MTKSNSLLLTLDEQAICEQIRNSNETPHGQRAQVLLVLNEGVSQVKTAELTGLTIGQVRYCLLRFRQLRTGIFSAEKPRRMTQVESKVTTQFIKPDSTIEDSTSQLKKIESKKKKEKKAKKKSDNKNKVTKGPDKKEKRKKSQKKKKNKKSKNKKKGKAKENRKSGNS